MQACDLENIGIVRATAPAELLKVIGAEIEKIKSDFSKAIPKNKTLAGNIIHEYELHDCRLLLEKFTREMAMCHQERYGANYNVGMNTHVTLPDGKKVDLLLHSAWVNFQQKGEFNPIHNHTGLYSFVLWYQVPYYANIEEASSPGRKANSNRAGKFEFNYTNVLGNVTGVMIDVDKKYEGEMVLFPSSLNHQVYPFYSSDKYRISVSGNLFLGKVDQ